MKIIEPSWEFLDPIDGEAILKKIELCGRVCYKSEKISAWEDTQKFVHNLIIKGHESVLEHHSISVKIVCDRGVSHEIVRHRIASYSQESTRYCNYSQEKFGREITVIKPMFWPEKSHEYASWETACKTAETVYFDLLDSGAKPQEARSVLPNSLKTEIVCTYNLRELRHFFHLRTDITVHPQMRQITVPMLTEFKKQIPVIFQDI